MWQVNHATLKHRNRNVCVLWTMCVVYVCGTLLLLDASRRAAAERAGDQPTDGGKEVREGGARECVPSAFISMNIEINLMGYLLTSMNARSRRLSPTRVVLNPSNKYSSTRSFLFVGGEFFDDILREWLYFSASNSTSTNARSPTTESSPEPLST